MSRWPPFRARPRPTAPMVAIIAATSASLVAIGVAAVAAPSVPAPDGAGASSAPDGAGASGARAITACGFHYLPTLGGRYGNVTAAAANGDLAGLADNAAGLPEPVLWRAGKPQPIRTGLLNSVPTGLNAHGDVVGNSSWGENTIGWIWSRHRVKRLRGMGALLANPSAISNRGVIAGALDTTEGLPNEGGTTPGGSENEQAAMWRSAASAPVKLPPLPGDQGGNAFAVDLHGRVGGVSEGARFRPVIWDRGGRPHLLPGLGGGYGAVRAFGPGGVAVGDAVAQNGTDHPVRWGPRGRITDLGLPAGSRAAQARDVLPSGVVVGTADMPVRGGGVVTQAVRWVQAGHPQLLAPRTGFEQTVIAEAVSARTAVGYLSDAKGGRHPVVWRCGR